MGDWQFSVGNDCRDDELTPSQDSSRHFTNRRFAWNWYAMAAELVKSWWDIVGTTRSVDVEPEQSLPSSNEDR
jgi:hypothetical protein